MRLTALIVSVIMLVAVSFGCGGAGSDPSFSPDPSVGDIVGGDEGGGGGGEVEVPGDDGKEQTEETAENDCFEDGFCNQRCASAEECPPGFSCIMSMCTFDCVTDDECGTGGVCNDSGLCEATDAEPMPGCTSDEECGAGRFCNSAGGCEKIPVFLGCQDDADCPMGQYCDEVHSCEIFPGAGIECEVDDDCPGNYHCGPSYLCVQECRTHYQCGDGQACDSDGYCVAVGAPAAIVSFSFNTAGAQTDPTGPVAFESANFRIDQVEIAPAGRSEMLTSPSFRLIGSTGF